MTQLTFTQTANLSITALCLYATPKILTYLCTDPDPATEARTGQWRSKLATVQNQFKEFVGAKAWFIMTDVIADNAWISSLVFSYLTKEVQPAKNLEGLVTTSNAYFTFCAASWVARFLCVKAFPSTRSFVATRHHG